MSQKQTYIIECIDRDGNLRRLIEYIGECGNTGHSFSIIVDPDASVEDGRKSFGWDGDGADMIISVKEKKIAQDERFKRRKEMVHLIKQLIPLVPNK